MKTNVNYTEVLAGKFNQLHKTLNQNLEEKITKILNHSIVKSEAVGWEEAYEQLWNMSDVFSKEQWNMIEDIDDMINEEGEYEFGFTYMEEPILIEALINYYSGFYFEPIEED